MNLQTANKNKYFIFFLLGALLLALPQIAAAQGKLPFLPRATATVQFM